MRVAVTFFLTLASCLTVNAAPPVKGYVRSTTYIDGPNKATQVEMEYRFNKEDENGNLVFNTQFALFPSNNSEMTISKEVYKSNASTFKNCGKIPTAKIEVIKTKAGNFDVCKLITKSSDGGLEIINWLVDDFGFSVKSEIVKNGVLVESSEVTRFLN